MIRKSITDRAHILICIYTDLYHNQHVNVIFNELIIRIETIL